MTFLRYLFLICSSLFMAVFCLILMVASCEPPQRPMPINVTWEDLIGNWEGHIDPYSVSKPKLPAGTLHSLSLDKDSTFSITGLFVPNGFNKPAHMINGVGVWSVNKYSSGYTQVQLNYYTPAGEDKHTWNYLKIHQANGGYDLRYQWGDPDSMNYLVFEKIELLYDAEAKE